MIIMPAAYSFEECRIQCACSVPGAGAEAFCDEVEGREATIVAGIVFGEEGGNFLGEMCCADSEQTDATIEIDDRKQ